MPFLSTLLTSVLQLVVMAAIIVAGVFTGKYLRKRKDMKQEESK